LNKKISRIVSYIIGIVILICISLYLYYNHDLLLSLKSITFETTFALIICWLIIYILRGYRIKILLDCFDIKAIPREWFGVTVIGAMSSYLIPQSGVITKGGYFRARRNLSISHFLSTQLVDYLLLFSINSLIGISILLFLNIKDEIKYTGIIVLSVFIVINGLLYFVKGRHIRVGNRFISDKLRSIFQGIDIIYKKPSNLILLVGSNLASIFVLGLWYYLAYIAIDIDISFLGAVLLGIVLNFSIVIRITPGNIGVQELVLALLSQVLEIKYIDGLTAAMIVRAVSLILSFLFGISFYYILLKPIKLKVN